MNLQNIFDHLSQGEFANLNLGGANLGISPRDYGKLAGSINMGLADLYTRFRLRSGKLTLRLIEDQTEYLLHSDYADSNSMSQVDEDERYIVDTAARPFQDDILKIERILDECDDPVALNKIDDPCSAHELDYRTLQFPEVDSEMADLEYTIHYRRGHRQLVEDDWEDPEDTDIALPHTHLQALCLYVASRHYTPIATAEGVSVQGNNYAAKYEVECVRLTKGGQEIIQHHDTNKFTARGFM